MKKKFDLEGVTNGSSHQHRQVRDKDQIAKLLLDELKRNKFVVFFFCRKNRKEEGKELKVRFQCYSRESKGDQGTDNNGSV